MFVEFTKPDGTLIAVNMDHVLYVAAGGNNDSFLYFGLLHSNFIEVTENYATTVGALIFHRPTPIKG